MNDLWGQIQWSNGDCTTRGRADGFKWGLNGLGYPDEAPNPTPYSAGFDDGHKAGREKDLINRVAIRNTLAEYTTEGRLHVLRALLAEVEAVDAQDRKERHESLVRAFQTDNSLRAEFGLPPVEPNDT